jgi:hypothetical protein
MYSLLEASCTLSNLTLSILNPFQTDRNLSNTRSRLLEFSYRYRGQASAKGSPKILPNQSFNSGQSAGYAKTSFRLPKT